VDVAAAADRDPRFGCPVEEYLDLVQVWNSLTHTPADLPMGFRNRHYEPDQQHSVDLWGLRYVEFIATADRAFCNFFLFGKQRQIAQPERDRHGRSW